jgi:hypothetical protein
MYTWSNGDLNQDLSQLQGGTYTVLVLDANGCEATQDFVVGSSVYVAENEGNINVEVYPNPNTGSFMLRLSDLQGQAANIEVLDAQGRVVYQSQLNAGKTGDLLSIDLQDAASGMYYLIISNDQGQYKGKVSVIR